MSIEILEVGDIEIMGELDPNGFLEIVTFDWQGNDMSQDITKNEAIKIIDHLKDVFGIE